MKKGFTLAELLAVIVVIAVIGLIAVTAISNTLREQEEKLYDTQVENIIKGAKLWANKHVFELPEKEGDYLIVTLGQLQSETFVEKDIKNPKNQLSFDQNMEIRITKQNNDYKYEIVE